LLEAEEKGELVRRRRGEELSARSAYWEKRPQSGQTAEGIGKGLLEGFEDMKLEPGATSNKGRNARLRGKSSGEKNNPPKEGSNLPETDANGGERDKKRLGRGKIAPGETNLGGQKRKCL